MLTTHLGLKLCASHIQNLSHIVLGDEPVQTVNRLELRQRKHFVKNG